jgi:hypothetical protein
MYQLFQKYTLQGEGSRYRQIARDLDVPPSIPHYASGSQIIEALVASYARAHGIAEGDFMVGYRGSVEHLAHVRLATPPVDPVAKVVA